MCRTDELAKVKGFYGCKFGTCFGTPEVSEGTIVYAFLIQVLLRVLKKLIGLVDPTYASLLNR
jgi:hypothetical protein